MREGREQSLEKKKMLIGAACSVRQRVLTQQVLGGPSSLTLSVSPVFLVSARIFSSGEAKIKGSERNKTYPRLFFPPFSFAYLIDKIKLFHLPLSPFYLRLISQRLFVNEEQLDIRLVSSQLK